MMSQDRRQVREKGIGGAGDVGRTRERGIGGVLVVLRVSRVLRVISRALARASEEQVLAVEAGGDGSRKDARDGPGNGR